MTLSAADDRQGAQSSEQIIRARAHPLTQFGFDALVAGASRPRPGAIAFTDHHDGATKEVSYADLYQRVGAFLARLKSLDFVRGERLLICCPPGAQSFVAVTAAVAAGFEPVLAPLPLPMTKRAVAGAARALQVAGLFSPSRICGVDLEEPLLAIAAETQSIRLIGALSGTLDGAADFSPDMLEAPLSPRARLSEEWSQAERPLVGALDEIGAIDFASQSDLLAAALDFTRLIRGHGGAPIVSLCAPSSLSSIVAGPLGALLTGAPLHFLAPYESAGFLALLDALGPARLVVPAALLPDLAATGLLSSGAILSVAALAQGATQPFEGAAGCPVVILAAQGGVVGSHLLGASYAPAHAEYARTTANY